MDPESISLLAGSIGRWVTYLGAVLVVGSVGAQMVVRRASRATGNTDTQAIELDALRVGLYGAVLLIVMAGWRLYAHTYSVFGIDEPVTWEYVRLIALDTGWGKGWQAQIVAAIVAAAVLASVRSVKILQKWGPGVAALGVAATLPTTGHAMSEINPWIGIPLQTIHVSAVGAWIGTLVVTLIVTRPRAGQTDTDGVFGQAIQVFSPIAVVAVSALAVTGLITAWVYLESISTLWSTAYGRTLSIKVFLFGLTGALGAYNWKKLKPTLGQLGSAMKLRKVSKIELTIGAIVLAVTAALVALSIAGMEH